MDKKNFTQTILNSLDEANKAMPSESFLLKMEALVLAYQQVEEKFSRKTLLSIAASLLLLISINTLLLTQNNQKDSASPVIEEQAYNLIPAKSIYHE